MLGGGCESTRAFAERVYGIPPEHVVGSQGKLVVRLRDGKPVLVKLPEVQFVDDGPGKPAASRPSSATGRSSPSEFPTVTSRNVQWTAAGAGRRFMVLVDDTDAGA